MKVEEALQTLDARPEDAAAWEAVALEAYPHLIAYVASLLLTFRVSPSEAAEDIVHDVFLKFYRQRTSGKAQVASVAAMYGYLRASCRNLLVDRYRRQRHADQLVDFLSLRFTNAFQDESDLYRSIFLNEILEMLPADCAALFRQYVTEDLTPAELAERENISPSTFYSKWYRCVRKAQDIFMQKKASLKRL